MHGNAALFLALGAGQAHHALSPGDLNGAPGGRAAVEGKPEERRVVRGRTGTSAPCYLLAVGVFKLSPGLF